MKELLLQPRLRHLASLVPQNARLADIGTDHGYLPVWLMQHGQITHAIAADIAPEPLEHARRTAAEFEVEGIDFRLCAGLNGIAPEEVDTVLIAGMGGDTIVSILQAAPWTKSGALLLLQPMTKVEMTRRWLADNGYDFAAESLVWDKEHLYPVMCVRGGERPPLTETETYAGVKLDADPLYKDYLAMQMSRLQKAAQGLRRANDEESRQKAAYYEEIYQALAETRNKL